MRYRALGMTLVLCGLAVLGVVAQDQGVGAGAFLQRGVDARALAMGGAFTAVADGYSSLYWNPAGLSRAVSTAQVGGMYTDIYGIGLEHTYLAGLYRWDMAFGERDPMPTGVGGAYHEIFTEVPGYDEQGNPLGLIRYSEGVFGLGLGTTVPELGSGGVMIKAYYFSAPKAGVGGTDAYALGVGFDLGIVAPVWEGLSIALVGTDIGETRVRWRNTATEPTDLISARYTIGAAYVWEGLVVAADLGTQPLLNRTDIRVGAEYTLLFASLRAGLRKPLDGPLSVGAGAGVSTRGLALDLAWILNAELKTEGATDTFVASASFRF